MAEYLWKPLGMKDATFHPAEGQRDRLARQFPNDPLTGKPQSTQQPSLTVPGPATASPGDLRKYYREQVQDIVYDAMAR